QELEALFGPGPQAQRELIQKRIAACHARSRLTKEIADWMGLSPLVHMIESDPESEAITNRLIGERKGVIVTTYHAGPKAGVWAYLFRSGIQVLKLQNHEWRAAPKDWTII